MSYGKPHLCDLTHMNHVVPHCYVLLRATQSGDIQGFHGSQSCNNIMPSLLSLVALEVAITTYSNATNDNKVGIMMTLHFQCNQYWSCSLRTLTHWGRITHIYANNVTIIGSDNGMSPDRRQAIIWTNAGILLIWPLVTNFSEIWKYRLWNGGHFISTSMC